MAVLVSGDSEAVSDASFGVEDVGWVSGEPVGLRDREYILRDSRISVYR